MDWMPATYRTSSEEMKTVLFQMFQSVCSREAVDVVGWITGSTGILSANGNYGGPALPWPHDHHRTTGLFLGREMIVIVCVVVMRAVLKV